MHDRPMRSSLFAVIIAGAALLAAPSGSHAQNAQNAQNAEPLAIVVNKSNTWADCLTTAELKATWNTGSKVKSWKDIRSSFPDVPLKLFLYD